MFVDWNCLNRQNKSDNMVCTLCFAMRINLYEGFNNLVCFSFYVYRIQHVSLTRCCERILQLIGPSLIIFKFWGYLVLLNSFLNDF